MNSKMRPVKFELDHDIFFKIYINRLKHVAVYFSIQKMIGPINALTELQLKMPIQRILFKIKK
jgi:hypothetical protein